jgi:hypothetical protein
MRILLTCVAMFSPLVAMTVSISAAPLSGPDAAAGPLVVSEVNPRYFTIGSGNDSERVV